MSVRYRFVYWCNEYYYQDILLYPQAAPMFIQHHNHLTQLLNTGAARAWNCMSHSQVSTHVLAISLWTVKPKMSEKRHVDS